jgi:hypothetical protein
MVKKNIKAKASENLESRVTALETRMAVLEQVSRKVVRRKRDYTDEERATIRARLLAGQEAARKRRANEAKAASKKKTATESVKAEKAKPVPTSEKS